MAVDKKAGSFLEMMGFPSPDKVFAEMQRLNNNLEKMQPDLHKLAQATDGLSPTELRNLTQVLQSIRTPELLKALNESNAIMGKFCNHLR